MPTPDYIEIPLTQGQVTRISANRAAEISKDGWYAVWSKSNRSFYAVRNSKVGEGTPRHQIAMHRFILGLVHGDPREGDHINHNTLDNTDENLRIVDDTGQSRNHSKRKDNKSGFRGVHFFKRNDKWGAGIRVNGKHIFLGLFPKDRPDLAALAYDAAAIEYFGEFAQLNFPKGKEITDEILQANA
jgi:hypothetical protein